MILDAARLKRIYKNPPTGDFQPYLGGSRREVDKFVRDMGARLAQSDLMTVTIDPVDLDSGADHHLLVVCDKRIGASTTTLSPDTPLLQVYISIKAPVAIWGATTFIPSEYRLLWTDLEIDTFGIAPPGDWDREIQEITTKLTEAGFMIADRQTLSVELPFDVDLFEYHQAGPPYTAFDLLFRWD